MLQPTASTGRWAVAASAVVVALLPAAAPAAVPRGGERYSGETEDALAVSVRVARSGRAVARFAIRYRVTCDNGAEGPVSTEVFDVRIRRGGTFAYTGTYRKRVDRSRNNVRLRGRISRRAASGTFSLSAVGQPEGADGNVRCRSGVLRWRAERDT